MTKNNRKNKTILKIISALVSVVILSIGTYGLVESYVANNPFPVVSELSKEEVDVLKQPHETSADWGGQTNGIDAYIVVNNNVPTFKKEEITTTAFEKYSPRDSLNRCGVAFACIGKEIMPTEKRGPIGMVKPSGWHTVRYDAVIDGNYLYNRCHLIAFELAGENANEDNLITGTRYMNVQGMLPFENKVALYVKETGNHVMYRVTPYFEGDDLVASAVQIEAYSVEDNGNGISFNVLCPNIQPDVIIRYDTGDSRYAWDTEEASKWDL